MQEIERKIEAENRTHWSLTSVLIGALKHYNAHIPACGEFKTMWITVISRQRLILRTTRLLTDVLEKH